MSWTFRGLARGLQCECELGGGSSDNVCSHGWGLGIQIVTQRAQRARGNDKRAITTRK